MFTLWYTNVQGHPSLNGTNVTDQNGANSQKFFSQVRAYLRNGQGRIDINNCWVGLRACLCSRAVLM